MNFQDYVSIICTSVAEQGYEDFSPSACVPGENLSMYVLDGQLSAGGEKDAAMAWITECFADHAEVFFAYRAGDRRVHVCWLKDWAIANRVCLEVEPAED